MEQSVPKRRYIKFRRRGIIQKNNTKNIAVCYEDYSQYTNKLFFKMGGVFSVKVVVCAVISVLYTLSKIPCLQLLQN
jgi:hypothetical protein